VHLIHNCEKTRYTHRIFGSEKGFSMSHPSISAPVAIVTGAGRGIGFGIASHLAERGYQVVIAEIDPATAQRAAEHCSAQGSSALAYPIDIGDTDAVQQMVDAVVQRWGRIDVLVNNAGVSERVAFLDVTPEQWDTLQRVNQRGVFFCLQAVAKQMIRQLPDSVMAAGQADHSYGKIINISSIAGRRGRADAIHYSVSKSAVITITQGAAMALARYGINVNAICPSVIPTQMWHDLDAVLTARDGLPAGSWLQQRIDRIPLKRAGTSEEIAAMVGFLCSEAGDYITGQTYNVDGGSELN
jgi:NAD(P)-dependent dehydrogenase (short-subunit alcohol dehydrogenase family)